MIDLLTDVAAVDEAYERFSVWGYGKTAWWWQHQCWIVRVGSPGELSLRFDVDGLWVGGGWGWPTSSQVERYRHAVDDDTSGPELVQIVETLRGLVSTSPARCSSGYRRPIPRTTRGPSCCGTGA